MPTPTHGPIKAAFVARIRANPAIKAALSGVHEGFAPEKTSYPFLTYNLVSGPYDYDWGSVLLVALIDAFVFSRNPVEADNLDKDLTAWLSDQPLVVEGQDTLTVRRVASIPMPPDIDDEGKKVYQVGGTYEVWTDTKLS